MDDARSYWELRVGFTAAVSHELRTPLARLMVLLETAALPGADRDQLIAQAREQVEQMNELVDDVLFLSELESGKEIVALGKQYFLLSRHTSLLVLENDEMYTRYGVTKGSGDTWAPYAMPSTIPTPR